MLRFLDSQPFRHFLVKKSAPGHVGLHPFAIDHELRDSALAETEGSSTLRPPPAYARPRAAPQCIPLLQSTHDDRETPSGTVPWSPGTSHLRFHDDEIQTLLSACRALQAGR